MSHFEAIELIPYEVGYPPWKKLYSKKLFNTASFPEVYFYEDIGITYKMILLADTIYFLDKVLYYYCYREGSITTMKTEKALRDWIEMYLLQYLDLAAWGYPMNKLKPLDINTALTYCIRKKPDTGDVNYVFCRNALRSAKMIPKDFTWRRKVLFVLLKHWPSLFELVCEMSGKRW